MKNFAEKYFKLLTTDLAGLNLTAIREFEEFYLKQVVDSILPLEQSLVFNECLKKTNLVVDVGFGGGFPLLPLAFQKPEIQFIGIEGSDKKVKAVEFLKQKLSLDSVKVFHKRLEDIFFNKSCVLTFKAVGKCHDYLKRIKTDQELLVFFYKGPNFHELEGKQLKNQLKDWEVIEEKFMSMETTEGRWLIGFKNKNVPYGTKLLKQQASRDYYSLVNLSDFL